MMKKYELQQLAHEEIVDNKFEFWLFNAACVAVLTGKSEGAVFATLDNFEKEVINDIPPL